VSEANPLLYTLSSDPAARKDRRALRPQIFLGALSSDETLRDWLVYAGASGVTITEQLIADPIIGRFYHTLGSQTLKAASMASEGVNWLSHAAASDVILIEQLVAAASVQDYLRYRESKQP
jgi:hypothetical protein